MTCFYMKSGETLNRYCYQNGLCYGVIYRYCDNLGLTPDEAVEKYQQEKRRIPKYRYKGISLWKYCKSKGGNNSTFSCIISKLKKKKGTLEEIVKHYLGA